MARMLPAEPRAAVGSEIEMFQAIKAGLEDTWTVIHSLGLTCHPDKPWTEIDFVLIGPAGVFCLEVKGGIEIRRHGTKWTYRDRRGRVVTRDESPFEQVGSASAALRKYVVGVDQPFSSAVFGHAVATPFVDFSETGPDITPELVYDASDHNRPFSEFLDRVNDYWTDYLQDQQRRTIRRLEPSDIDRMVGLLAGDFRLTRGLAGRIEDVGRVLVRLTDEQFHVLENLENERAVIRGGAGTGKTLLALATALQSPRAGKRTMLTCYSRRLGDWLGAQAHGVENLEVTSLHRFMRETIERTDRLGLLPPAEPDHLFQVEYPVLCMEAMLDLGLTVGLDMLVVDEAQDLLVPGYLDVFDQLLDQGLTGGNWRIFLDPRQDIFNKANVLGLQRINDLMPGRYRLTINCRNTRQIATSTAILSGAGAEETLQADGPEVEHIWWSSQSEQRRKVSRYVGRLLSSGIPAEQIVVLASRNIDNTAMAGGFQDLPYSLSEYGDSGISFSTIAGFKGLESDVVVLIDVDELNGQQARADLYVATSRARSLLAVAINEDLRQEYEALAKGFGARVVDDAMAVE